MNHKLLIYLFIYIAFAKYSWASTGLELYQAPSEFLYPSVYIPNRVVYVSTLTDAVEDLKANSSTVNAYVIEEASNGSTSIRVIPHFKYKKLSQEKYLLEFEENISYATIILNQEFHGAWRIRYMGDNKLDCVEAKEYPKFGISECVSKKYSIFEDFKLSFFTHKQSTNNKHYVINGMMNGWDIDDLQKGLYIIEFGVHPYFLAGVSVLIITSFFAILKIVVDKIHRFNDV